jgi:hypothetical protein
MESGDGEILALYWGSRIGGSQSIGGPHNLIRSEGDQADLGNNTAVAGNCISGSSKEIFLKTWTTAG